MLSTFAQIFIMSEIIFFTVFLALVAAILVFDLGLLNKESHIVKPKEALSWTLVWLSLAMGFYFFLMHYGYLIHGIENTEQILAKIDKYKHIINYEGTDFEGLLGAYHQTLAQEFLTSTYRRNLVRRIVAIRPPVSLS